MNLTKEQVDELRDYVNRGASLLDSTNPGWPSRINLYLFNINECSGCVLGQLYGDWGTGEHILHLDTDDSHDHGFSVEDNEPGMPKWEALQELWIKAINQRLDKTE